MIWQLHICFRTFALALVLLSVSAAATVSGHVELVSSHDPNVRKHTDYSGVVVWLEPVSGTPVIAASAGRAQMVQKNKTFTPHVLAITVGTVVDFPNNHLSYAITWFGLAAGLIGVYFAYHISKGRLGRA